MNKETTLSLFREVSNEEFLCPVQDVENWITDYELNQGNSHRPMLRC